MSTRSGTPYIARLEIMREEALRRNAWLWLNEAMNAPAKCANGHEWAANRKLVWASRWMPCGVTVGIDVCPTCGGKAKPLFDVPPAISFSLADNFTDAATQLAVAAGQMVNPAKDFAQASAAPETEATP